jgi:hypothetical protein
MLIHKNISFSFLFLSYIININNYNLNILKVLDLKRVQICAIESECNYN